MSDKILNMPQVLNIPGFLIWSGIVKIIIVTNIIISFLSVRFVDPGVPQLTSLSFLNTS